MAFKAFGISNGIPDDQRRTIKAPLLSRKRCTKQIAHAIVNGRSVE
jgi:hypothetical protein